MKYFNLKACHRTESIYSLAMEMNEPYGATNQPSPNYFSKRNSSGLSGITGFRPVPNPG